MRFLQAVLLLAFLGAVGAFAVQNMQTVQVRYNLIFVNWGVTAPLALVALTIYALGMLTGWTVVAFIQRSLRRLTERRES